ncbi:MAG: glycosyltransferase, partial [Fervidobacterium sp.]
ALKFEKLSKKSESLEELEKKFRFSIRILAENLSIKYASFIVCSTKQERYEQYSHKLYSTDPCSEKFKVIAPGINTKIFKTQEEPHDKLIEEYLLNILSNAPINRQRLPFIIMSSRLDKKKNHISVVKAFIENQDLKQNANLIIVVRGVDDIDNFIRKNSEESEILKEIVKIGKSELNKSIFFANITDQKSLASLYRIGAKRGSVFVLPAIYEPFGLAIVEAAACGLKVVATMNGGPSEILSNSEGLLVDPEDTNDIALKLYISLTKFSNEKSLELANKYSWEKTGELYLKYIAEVLKFGETKENTSNIKTFTNEIEKDLDAFIKKIEEIKFS